LGRLREGERVLVHAGAGGVGMAAIQIARHGGAEVYATASPAKWDVLRELGLDDDHIASSRDLDFRERFLEATGEEGMDLVLDSLAGEFVDASLDLLPRGGRFVEIGKADVREPETVAEEHSGVEYRAFDLVEAGPERIQEMMVEVVGLLEGGALRHPPVTSWDVHRAPAAFRHMREARHVGKIVLSVPRTPEPDGTILITGGTGGLGALLARHLAERGAGRLVLTSRRGAETPGVDALEAELRELGATPVVAACDVADRDQLEALLGEIPDEHPLTTVIHAAGVLDDGTIGSLTREQLDRVMRPKVDGALNLHELTAGLDLAEFLMFSSLAGTLGSPGQANYAAANAFLDALARSRQADGLPAKSLVWGAWSESAGMAGDRDAADTDRLRRLGAELMTNDEGLALFDAARDAGDAVPVPVRLDTAALRAQARDGLLPPILSGLVRAPSRSSGARTGSLARRLAELPEDKWDEAVLELVRRDVAAVLGHDSPDQVGPQRSFKELGFDSLSAVELRNRLTQTTGLRLTSTLVFDHPTIEAAARFVRSEVSGVERREPARPSAPTRSDEPIAIVGMSCRYPGGASSPDELWELVTSGTDAISSFPDDRGWDVDRLYDPDPDKPHTCYVREGGFLYDATDFDARFFKIGQGEATAMDPQQRLMLETTWDAFQNAGIDPASLRETDTGVFAGAIEMGYRREVPAAYEAFRMTGTTLSVLSGRLAHTFGLQGPAMTVDTACSSSLVALHLACQSLIRGECSLALAGGVTVMAAPDLFVDFARQRGLAPDGRCKSYGAGADGTGFSEGAGVLVLERLSEARRLGHRVLAVVRGSAVNQD
ncbi:MAG TPA: type I polyketide synthase, partial [Thermoleophilaceae bacterium]